MSFRTKKSLDMYCKSSYILLVVAACAIVSDGDKSEATVGKPKIVSTSVGTTGGIGGGLASSSLQRNSSFKGGTLSSGISGNATAGSSRRSSISSAGSVTSQQSGSIGTGGTSSLPTGKIQHKYGVSAGDFKVLDLDYPINPNERYVQFTNLKGELVTYKESLSAKAKLLWNESEIGRDKYIGSDGKVHTYIYRSRPNWVSGRDIIEAQGGSVSDLQQHGIVSGSSAVVGSSNKSIGTQTDGNVLGIGKPKTFTSQLNLNIDKDGNITQSKGTNTGADKGVGTSDISKTKLNFGENGKVTRSIGTNTEIIDGDGKVIGKSVGVNTSLSQEKDSGTGGTTTTRIFLNKNIQTSEDEKSSSVVTSSVQTVISGSGEQPKKRINKGIGTQTDSNITGEGTTVLSGTKETIPVESVVYKFEKMPKFVVNEGDENKGNVSVKSVVYKFGKMPRFVPIESSGGTGDKSKKVSTGLGTDIGAVSGKTTQTFTDESGTSSGGTYVSTLKVNLGGKKDEQLGIGDEKRDVNKYLESLVNKHGSLLLRKDVGDDGTIITTDYTKQILGTGDPVVVSSKSSSTTDKGKASVGTSLITGKQTQSSTGTGDEAQGTSGVLTGGKKSSTVVVEKGESSKRIQGTSGKLKEEDKAGTSSVGQQKQEGSVEDPKPSTSTGKGSLVTSSEGKEKSSIITTSTEKKQTAQVVVGEEGKSVETTGSKKSSTVVVEQGESSKRIQETSEKLIEEDKASASSGQKLQGEEGSEKKNPIYIGSSLKELQDLTPEQLIEHAKKNNEIDLTKVNLVVPKNLTEKELEDFAKKNPIISYNVDEEGNIVEVNNIPKFLGIGNSVVTKVYLRWGNGKGFDEFPIFSPYKPYKVGTQGSNQNDKGNDSSSMTGNQGGVTTKPVSAGGEVQTSLVSNTGKKSSSTLVGQRKQGESSTSGTGEKKPVESSGGINFNEVKKNLKPVSGTTTGKGTGTSEGIDFNEAKKNLRPVSGTREKKPIEGSDGINLNETKKNLKPVSSTTTRKGTGTSEEIDFNEAKKNLRPVLGNEEGTQKIGGDNTGEKKTKSSSISQQQGEGSSEGNDGKYKAVLVEVDEKDDIVEKISTEEGKTTSSLINQQQGESSSEGNDGIYKAVFVEVDEEGQIVDRTSTSEKKTTSSIITQEHKSSLIIQTNESKVSKKPSLGTIVEEGSGSSGIDFNEAKKNLKPVSQSEKGGQKTGFDESDIQKAKANLKKVPIGQGMYDSDSDDDEDISNYILTGKSSGMSTGGRNQIDFQKNVNTDEKLIDSQGRDGFVSAATQIFETRANEDKKIKVSNQTGNINVETGTDESGNVKINTNTTTRNLENVGPLNVDTKFAKRLAKDIDEGYKKKLQEMENKDLNQ